MAYLELSVTGEVNGKILIMIFVEGTILKPKSLFSLYCHHAYVPIGRCVDIIAEWQRQGAEIVYCTSRRKRSGDTGKLLRQFGFVGTKLYYREKGEKYKDIAEGVLPDVLLEDDCRSIGGSWQMCITKVNAEAKRKIKSIVVREFEGIDLLPEKLSELLALGSQ